MIGTMLQEAGPTLNPLTVERGLVGTQYRRGGWAESKGNPTLALVKFGPNDYNAVSDFREVYWDAGGPLGHRRQVGGLCRHERWASVRAGPEPAPRPAHRAGQVLVKHGRPGELAAPGLRAAAQARGRLPPGRRGARAGPVRPTRSGALGPGPAGRTGTPGHLPERRHHRAALRAAGDGLDPRVPGQPHHQLRAGAAGLGAGGGGPPAHPAQGRELLRRPPGRARREGRCWGRSSRSSSSVGSRTRPASS